MTLANVFAPELETTRVAPTLLVVALGRVPERRAGDASFVPPGCAWRRLGDCLGPRSLEEAILEGVLAARRVSDASAALEAAPEVVA